MRTGVVLPSFRRTAEDALEVAHEAEQVGVDGVFCYDHLWPMGQPERPALAPFPVLAAVARRTRRLWLGPLVARVGIVADEVLLSQFGALEALAPGRVIGGLGTGDRLSHAENEAYGVPAGSAADRRAAMGHCASVLRSRGVPVWIGGGSARTRAVAEATGSAVNLWSADPAAVAEQGRRTEVTWGGPTAAAWDAGAGPDARREGLARLLGRLDEAGASWAVFAWPVPLALLVECAGRLAGGR
ncbi:MAG TPA: LLM class flavin-dependent oxidoreductase [Acidimicrobiales bacterium]|jgi:alkanesulfonate monooxygenase SsuD/methylene tetrahydromethanopterin reductase-like flavin-dependent oxidoreductase (luciferase family)